MVVHKVINASHCTQGRSGYVRSFRSNASNMSVLVGNCLSSLVATFPLTVMNFKSNLHTTTNKSRYSNVYFCTRWVCWLTGKLCSLSIWKYLVMISLRYQVYVTKSEFYIIFLNFTNCYIYSDWKSFPIFSCRKLHLD